MKLPYITVAILVTSLLVGGILADEKIIRKRTRRSKYSNVIMSGYHLLMLVFFII